MIPRAPESFPAWENQRLRAELHQVLEEVIDSGCLVLGRQVQCLERELAAHLGVAEVVGLASGSDALEIALRHLGVRAGQHVVVPALCPSAVPSAVMRLGARPLLVDVDAQSLNLDVSALAACLCRPLQPPAAAVIAVHLFGWPVDWSALEALCRKHDVALLEDASHGFGGSWQGRALGTLGRLAAACTCLVPLPDVFVEHRTYLASMGLLLCVMPFLRITMQSRWRMARALSWALALTVLAFSSAQRCDVLDNATSLWQDSLAKGTKSARVYKGLGIAAFDRGNVDEAGRWFELATEIDPGDFESWYNLATVRLSVGDFPGLESVCLRAQKALGEMQVFVAYGAKALIEQG